MRTVVAVLKTNKKEQILLECGAVISSKDSKIFSKYPDIKPYDYYVAIYGVELLSNKDKFEEKMKYFFKKDFEKIYIAENIGSYENVVIIPFDIIESCFCMKR